MNRLRAFARFALVLTFAPAGQAQDVIAISWPGDVYAIDSATGTTSLLGPCGFASTNSMAVTASGIVYSVSATDLITIDPLTGLGTLVGPLSGPPFMRALAYDEVSSTLFGVTTSDLYEIDTVSGAATLIGPTGIVALQAACSTPTGELYVWNSWGGVTQGGLFQLDKVTGAATVIAPSAGLYNYLTSDAAGNLFIGRNVSNTVESLDFFGNTTPAFTHTASDLRGLDFIALPTQYETSCFGDGGDQMGCTECPCGNNAAIGSTGGCLNSNGTGARLEASGVPSVGNDTMRFSVVGANASTFGILTSGDNRLPNSPANPCFAQNPGSGVQAPGILDGLRCIGGALIRHGSRASDVNGDIGLTNNGWGPPSGPAGGLIAQGGFSAGQTRHFQCFYRESTAAVCLSGQNTTSAASATFVP